MGMLTQLKGFSVKARDRAEVYEQLHKETGNGVYELMAELERDQEEGCNNIIKFLEKGALR